MKFFAGDEAHPLGKFERFENRTGSPVMQNSRPARVLFLRGGGRLTAEWIESNNGEITIHFRGKRLTLPRREVLAIAPLETERPLLFEDFSAPPISSAFEKTKGVRIAKHENRSAALIPPGELLSYSPQEPFAGVRWSMAFFDAGREKSSHVSGLLLDFGEGPDPQNVRILLSSGDKSYKASGSAGLKLRTQPIARGSGWHRLTVLSDEGRFQVLIGNRLLASGRPPGAPLNQIRVFSEMGENSSEPGSLWIDDVMLDRLVPASPAKAPAGSSFDDQDRVILATGDGLFGKVHSIESREVRLSGAFGETSLSWGNIQRVIFFEIPSESRVSPGELSPLGWAAELMFHRFADHPGQPGDFISVMILSADEESLKVFHRWLGTFEVKWEEVAFLRPRFLGRSQILSFEARHLGDPVKSELPRKEPIGTAWSGEFSLENPIQGSAFLRIEAAELEPAGPGTAPGSRFLSELRNGFLGTELFVNRQSLGRLNDQISRRHRADDPASLRLAIPVDLLKAGRNTWRIAQRPLAEHSNEHDDCQLGPIVLEFEEATSP